MRHPQTPDPKTRYFLCQYRTSLSNIHNSNGFVIKEELTGPEIPADLDIAGHYVVLEIVRKFRIDAIITNRTEELPI